MGNILIRLKGEKNDVFNLILGYCTLDLVPCRTLSDEYKAQVGKLVFKLFCTGEQKLRVLRISYVSAVGYIKQLRIKPVFFNKSVILPIDGIHSLCVRPVRHNGDLILRNALCHNILFEIL